MPNANKFRLGFGLRKGHLRAGYKLVDVNVGHELVQRYREYRYPISMTWRATNLRSNESALLDDLHHELSGSRVIKSAYGNPYKCNITGIKPTRNIDGTVTVEATGRCYRI